MSDNDEMRWVGAPGGAMSPRGKVAPLRRFEEEEPRPLRLEQVEVEPAEPGLAVNLLHYTHVLLKRRWLIAAFLVLGVAAGFAVTLLTTPMYRASMTLDIDREPAKIVAVEAEQTADTSGSAEFYQTQYAALKSRALAERVVNDLNLAYDERFLNQYNPKALLSPPPPPEARTARDRRIRTDRATGLVMDGLKVEPVQRSRLVRVSYESPDPAIAARIANAVAPNFIAANLERRYGASSYARQFLESRLTQIRQKLEESERQLVAYAADKQIVTVTSGGSAPGTVAPPPQSLAETDLAAAAQARSQANIELINAQEKWRMAQSTPGNALPDVLADGSYRVAEENLAKLKADYQQNLSRYQPTHRDMVKKLETINTEEQRIAGIAQDIKNSLRNQYEVALARQQKFATSVAKGTGDVLDTRVKSIQYNILQREVDTNRVLYDGLLQRYKEIGVAGGIGNNNISVLDRAQVPAQPFSPEPKKNLIKFALAGVALGVMIALLLEQFDVSIKIPEEVEETLNLPLLGVIPIIERGMTPQKALADPRSALSEGYHSVRTALQFSTEDGVPSSLLITSPRAAEGKTTTAVAIATSFARLGKRVLIVDADLRAPSLHKIFARDNGVGLSNLLTGATDFLPAAQPTDQKNLTFLGSGPLPPNPAELFSGDKMWSFLKAASQNFDLIVIDGPPVMGLADSPSLASIVQGTVVVVEAGGTNREIAKSAIKRLKMSRARILGVLMTKFNARKAGYRYGHAYGYGYGYGHEYGAIPNKNTKLARLGSLFGRSSAA